ncbi:MAG: cysteine synthase family protein [Thermoanaerobaculia bacterium]|nr:MAG: cysteine synthase family protein [Thermoanaerobaculia bacterium]
MNDERVCDRVSDAVGGTPLVRLRRALPGFAGEVFAKLEFVNPMGSVKDRIARYMVERAFADGRLRPGGTLIEASSGNTAMGLAMMAIERDLRCVMVVRRQTSPEKRAALAALGVELVLVDGDLPPEHPESYNRKARQLAAEIPGAYFPDQHNDRANNDAHYATTGPEIWRQMGGRIDWFVAGIGTGGTVSGVARYLKEQDPRVKVLAVDIEGSVFTEYFRTGRHGAPRRYRVEGLGDEEIIACPEFELIDDMVQVSDRDAFQAARELARREAIFAGGSSGAALWGVRQLAGRLEAPARIVTLFPDSGNRYLSTIYDDAWLAAQGLAAPAG